MEWHNSYYVSLSLTVHLYTANILSLILPRKAVTDAIYEKVFLKFEAGEILADNRGNSAASF